MRGFILTLNHIPVGSRIGTDACTSMQLLEWIAKLYAFRTLFLRVQNQLSRFTSQCEAGDVLESGQCN